MTCWPREEERKGREEGESQKEEEEEEGQIPQCGEIRSGVNLAHNEDQ